MTQHLIERPEVAQFVDLVRLYLGDLDDDVRDELTEGLAADLSELVDDRGAAALPDPEAYADELRTAAGLPARGRRRLSRRRPRLGRLRDLPERTDRRLDALAGWWSRWTGAERRRRAAYELAVSLRPVWWVARGYLAVQLVWLVKNQAWSTLFPFYDRHPAWATVLMAAAVLGSVQVGRGWWPMQRDGAARILLLGLNALAVVMVPVAIMHAPPRGMLQQRVIDTETYYSHGVFNDGRYVCNLQPYNRAGQPLDGVQLVDDHGRRVDLRCDGADRQPWMMGDQVRYNVFPQHRRRAGRAPSSLQTTVAPVTGPTADSD